MNKRIIKRVISLVLSVVMVLGCFMTNSAVSYAAEGDKVKIACVGDSLTEGYTSSGSNKGSTAYPAVLQNLLGSDYQVGNFGRTSFTLMKGTNKSYWDAAEFTNSKAFDANIVIIMLGTNDSKDAYWNETKFKEDAVALYNTYANLESVERIIFATSPHCYVMSGTDITAAGVDRMVAVQRELIAENNWESVDMYALTADREDYFKFSSSWDTANGGNGHTWAVLDANAPQDTYYEVYFTGNKIDVYAGKNSMYGIMEYFVDGTSYGKFDLYRSSNSHENLITTISGLEEGAHVFKAVATGEKNAAHNKDL